MYDKIKKPMIPTKHCIHKWLFTLLLLAGLAVVAGCQSGGNADCTTGECSSGGDECEAGAQGCVCAAGNRCGTDSAGDALMCMDGLCQLPSCMLGDTGCICRDGDSCNAAADVCLSGYCQPEGCLPGEENCECLAGGCDPGLMCRDGSLCVSNRGYEGGFCLDNDRCRRGNRCDTDLGICVHCEPGTQGCQCSDADTCSAGLRCSAGLCLPASAVPPDDPVCYTPCESDLVTGSDVRTCGTDGLLPGCIGDQTCDQGSCVVPGESKPGCDDDLDCPSFQVCLQGGCYSNCERSSECATGLSCYQKSCRVPCESTVGGDNCPTGYYCSAPDAENGYCLALIEPADIPAGTPTGGFTLSTQLLEFTNIKTSGGFQIRSDDIYSQDFTIRKLSHRMTRADGTVERVEARRDPATGDYLACDPVRGECPLFWLDMSHAGTSTRTPTLEVHALPECGEDCPVIGLANAGGSSAVRWSGQLEVASRNGRAIIELDYVERPDGQWAGTMHYFGSFGDIGVDAWLSSADRSNAEDVENGLIKKWVAFRRGNMDSWSEMLAVLTATDSESWRFGNVVERCGGSGAACYPYENSPTGLRTYVDNLASAPIPTGLTELPIAVNLRLAGAAEPEVLEGRIESSATLHYPGNPAISLQLDADPLSAAACDPRVQSDCVVPIAQLAADIVVGGRFIGDVAGGCGPGYQQHRMPWLADGFSRDTELDQGSGLRYQNHCLDGAGANLSRGNPVPDGHARVRELRLLDGALINQTELFILFEERFSSFIGSAAGDDTVSTYGYMILRRQPHDLDPNEAFDPTPPGSRQETAQQPLSCDSSLLERLGFSNADLTTYNQQDLDSVVDAVLTGTKADPLRQPLPRSSVHYLCEDTGAFDDLAACPAGSKVTYFVVTGPSESEITGHDCQQEVQCTTQGGTGAEFPLECTGGTCQAVLNQWRVNGAMQVYEPYWRCEDPSRTYCDDNRLDLRVGKTFYPPAPGQRVMVGLQPAIADAFRYKTRFQSRSGQQVGFAPEICIPGSDQIPYCYDPGAIEEILQRTDCLLEIYADGGLHATLSSDARSTLERYLRGNFSEFDDLTGARDGFERLYAELVIMQGDEALTRAFASRFDLAATGGAGFQGALFEAGGINLSGVAGFEMVSLYKAAQYYQMALDRLYSMGPHMAAALARGSTDQDANFVSPDTVTLYFDRLIRASTQQARTWSEVAKRYQNFNRPDLARRVVERAYTATYLEGVIVSQTMHDIADDSQFADVAQIQRTIDNAQRGYRMALLDMRDVYASITNDVNFFGFAADYIPFPTLDAGNVRDTNAFEVLMLIASNKLAFARQREDQALASNRSVESDAATFQAELVRVRNNYESQLLQLCGGFEADDGRVYPAIEKYASLHPATTLLGDPCGFVGTGEIHDAMSQVDVIHVDLLKALQAYDNVLEEVDIEIERVEAQCDLIDGHAAFVWDQQGERMTLERAIRASELIKDEARQAFMIASSVQELTKCAVGTSTDCPSGAVAAAVTLGIGVQTEKIAIGAGIAINAMQAEIDTIERETARFEIEHQCDVARVDSEARVKTLLLRLKELDLESLQVNYRLRLALSAIQHLFHRGARLQIEQAESEQMLINVEAARNNPNFRVYRNDAIINADIAFVDALRAAYRATKVFEYYTSQSYAGLEQLFLIRMIGAGDYNLENYLVELQNAFFDFEEQFGLPDTRVAVLSLKDDVLRIPTKDDQGLPLNESQRHALLAQRLRDVRLLDKNGYLTIPFRTNLDNLSPLTRNHKIVYMEANMNGQVGDDVGRLYMRQVGTGVVHGVGGDKDYFVFPERTAVLNPFFNGNRRFSPEVYRSSRFRDRPLVNTGWELIINQRDEVANMDIDLQSISDITVFVYYTDFTVF